MTRISQEADRDTGRCGFMNVVILSARSGWHTDELCRALAARGHEGHVVGYDSLRALQDSFTGCRLAARIDNGVQLDNEEQGGPVWLCAATVEPWSTLWPRLRHLHP